MAGEYRGFYQAAAGAGVVVKINHPGPGTNVFNALAYSAVGDQAVELMEVRRTQEQEAYVRALKLGWHLAPDGAYDTHSTKQLAGRIEGQHRTRGAAEQESGSTPCVDGCFDVFNLALDRIRKRVGAFAAATAAVVDDGEFLGQASRELGSVTAVRLSRGHKDNRRSRT